MENIVEVKRDETSPYDIRILPMAIGFGETLLKKEAKDVHGSLWLIEVETYPDGSVQGTATDQSAQTYLIGIAPNGRWWQPDAKYFRPASEVPELVFSQMKEETLSVWSRGGTEKEWGLRVDAILEDTGIGNRDTYTLACLNVSFMRYYSDGLDPFEAVAVAAEDYAATPAYAKGSITE